MKKIIIALLAIMIFSCVVVGATVIDDLKAIPKPFDSSYKYCIFANDSTITTSNARLFVSSATMCKVYAVEGIDSFGRCNNMTYYGGGGSIYSYSNGSWVYQGVATGTVASPVYLRWSNTDIVNERTSTVFFSQILPPVVTVESVTQSSLGNLTNRFGQDLTTLLPIGVIILCLILAVYLIRRLVLSFL